MKMDDVWNKINNADDVGYFGYLRDRWADEHEYEDIKDYLKAVQNRVPSAYKMTKRPFGFLCDCEDGILKISVKVNGRYVSLSGEMVDKVA